MSSHILGLAQVQQLNLLAIERDRQTHTSHISQYSKPCSRLNHMIIILKGSGIAIPTNCCQFAS